MNLSVAFESAFNALRENKLRSFLTMLGIMIGVAAVLSMMAIGEGSRRTVLDRIDSLGANVLTVRPGADRRGGRSQGADTAKALSEFDVQALRKEPYVAAATGSLSTVVTLVSGNTNWTSGLNGIDGEYFHVQEWSIASGRSISGRDVNAGAAVAVIGQTVKEMLFPNSDPVGERIRINNVPFRIIGVLEEKGQIGFGRDQDDVVMVPLSTARNRLIGGDPATPRHIARIEVLVKEGFDMAVAQLKMEEKMRELRRIKPGTSDDFRVFSIADFIRARSSAEQTLSVLLAFMGAVSLIVGGVGVMNIMLVSVTERTREIGLRMAIGARQGDIMIQFLIEATVLCVIGGVLGLLIGLSTTHFAGHLGDMEMRVSFSIILVSLGAAVAVGIFFGFFPARRAARLSPIEALRHD